MARHCPALCAVALSAILGSVSGAAGALPGATLHGAAGLRNYSRVSIGDRLERDFGVYAALPVSAKEATAQGWYPMQTKCSPGLGVPYAQADSSNATAAKEPLVLYFTPAGQVTGAGVVIVGDGKPELIDKGYLLRHGTNSEGYDLRYISVSFRDPAGCCSATPQTELLGDRLVVNQGPGGIAKELPVTRDDARAAGWVPGSCFSGMGRHWFKDLTGPDLTWYAKNLLPVVVMYDEESASPTNTINAFFFASSDRQQNLLPRYNANQWEPIPLPTAAMCLNMCNSSCTFHDTGGYGTAFSTLHLYMNDRAKVTCNGGCSTSFPCPTDQCGCCDGPKPLPIV